MDTINFTVNHRPINLKVDGDRKLLYVLRSDLGITGPKFGCGEGICGSCTVLIDDKAERSCQVPVKDVNGHRVVTIEGFSARGSLHPVQKAFLKYDAFQCGYCTPGMILTAFSFLKENPNPTKDEIIRGMDDNLCRCGAQKRIVAAIQAAAKEMRSGRTK